jgi:putative endonuclease
MFKHYVYVLCSEKYGTLYIGVTHNIAKRVYEHQKGLIEGFTKKYQVCKLVHVECYDLMIKAIRREKVLKHWKREWKINLVSQYNPEWKDLSECLRDFI